MHEQNPLPGDLIFFIQRVYHTNNLFFKDIGNYFYPKDKYLDMQIYNLKLKDVLIERKNSLRIQIPQSNCSQYALNSSELC